MTDAKAKRGRPKRSTAVDPEVVRAWVERTRIEQGLPKHLEDPVIIARIVAIFQLAREDRLRRQASLKAMGTERRMSSSYLVKPPG